MTELAADPKLDKLSAGDHAEGMSYLETLPRRLVTLYMPLGIILVVLLFPFYWMTLTAIKPDEQLLDLEKFNPYWTTAPTLKHIVKLLFESPYPEWLWNTMLVAVVATTLSPTWCRRRSCSSRCRRSCSNTGCSTRRSP
jgi:multiple sugar transport system permease protein